MKTIASVALEALAPGVRLAQAVVDEGGRVLVPAGAELTDSMIASLSRRGIASVQVETDVAEDPAECEARRAQVTAQLDKLFRVAARTPGMETIYAAVLDYRMEHRA